MFATPFELSILRQEALAREKFSRNAQQKDVCVVAKGLAFSIDITAPSVNFQCARIYAKLYYDADDEDYKPIELPKSDPLTYKVFMSSCGDRATVECRIYVLTSQHENALFRVKIGLNFGAHTAEVTSAPIRVLSKPSQIQKEKRKRAGTVSIATDDSLSIPSTPAAAAPSSASKKVVPPTDANVMETLKRMEEQQNQQRTMIEQLVRAQHLAPPPAEDSEDEFESAFTKFICAWNKLPHEERPTKMRKMMSCAPDTLVDFLQTCEVKTPIALADLEAPVTLKEQEAWDSIYTNYTWSPESDPQC